MEIHYITYTLPILEMTKQEAHLHVRLDHRQVLRVLGLLHINKVSSLLLLPAPALLTRHYSASEVTTLRCHRNVCMYVLLLLLITKHLF